MMSDEEYDEQFLELQARFSKLFQSSHTPSDISRALLSIVRSYPTSACTDALATSTLKYAQVRPQGVDALVAAVKTLVDTLEVSPIAISGDAEMNSFEYVFSYLLSDFLNYRLSDADLHIPKQTKVIRTNTALSAALLSASINKHRLFEGHSATHAFSRQGLQLPLAEREPGRDEVMAVGACLQLSVAGATMMEDWLGASDGQDAVLKALKGLKEHRVVASSGGMCLLEKTTLIAEGKFSEAISPAHAWGILFSSSFRRLGSERVLFSKGGRRVSNSRLPLVRSTLRVLALRR